MAGRDAIKGVLLDVGDTLTTPRGGRWNPRFDFEDTLRAFGLDHGTGNDLARAIAALSGQHEHRGTFTDDEAVSLDIERARDPARAENAEQAEARDHQRIGVGADTTTERDIDLAQANRTRRLDDRCATRRTREREGLDRT